MFKKITVEGLPLTIELVRNFAALPPLPGEREIRPVRRDFLLTHLRRATFGGPSWAQGRCLADGITYRLDGQHSSSLLNDLPADVQFPVGLLVTIDTWEFDSLTHDGAALFDLFNHPRSARTNEDVMGIYKARAISLAEIDRAFLVKVTNGIVEYERAKREGDTTRLILAPRVRGVYLEQAAYAEFACWMAAFRDMKNAAFLNRTGIVAEMVADWLHDGSRATEFWQYVLRENHPEVDHETRTLAETFRSWHMHKKYKTPDYRKKAATAWKHFLRELQAVAA